MYRMPEAARRLCGSVDLVHKLHAERFTSTPHDLASLACQRMWYGRKPKRTSHCDIDLGHELRTIQRHIQHLALVADKVIIEYEPCGKLPRSSRFTLLLCNKHQNTVTWDYELFLLQKRPSALWPSTPFLPFSITLNWRAKLGIEGRRRFVPAAAFSASRLVKRDPEALFLSPNHFARMDFVFRMNNQCELVGNADMRPGVESDPCRRKIAKYAGHRDVSKSNGAAL
jgi:hypothetical protein